MSEEAGVATMKDVAERANVSIATVSFVVNKTKRVSPDTKARIVAAMEELGYRRNVVARALASRRTRIIALLFPALDHRLGSTALSFVTSAAGAAGERGYSLVLWPVSNDADQMTELISGGLVDGVLLMEVQMDDARVDRLVESGVPFAMIGRTKDPSGIAFVDMDFERTVENGIEYLVDLGHQRIALILESLEGSAMAGYGPPVRTELKYRESMLSRGLDPVVVTCEESPLGGRGAAAELLAVDPDVTAIIVMNEEAAFGIVSGLGRAGRAVPDDISILSMATSPEMGAFSEPVLTTMNAPGVELGRLGVEALIDQLEGTATELLQVLLGCPIQEGDSTAPARQKSGQVG
jgi:DNA-binding LacI/PurR family transcriptional regulator